MGEPTLGTCSRKRQTSKFRSTSLIAFVSAMPASAPALVLTGSFALCALVATVVVACVGLAALMI